MTSEEDEEGAEKVEELHVGEVGEEVGVGVEEEGGGQAGQEEDAPHAYHQHAGHRVTGEQARTCPAAERTVRIHITECLLPYQRFKKI